MAVSAHSDNSGRVLGDVAGTPKDEIDEYITILVEMADASGGGLTDAPQAVGDCPDWEDNRILDLALAVSAFMIVSGDIDLTTMSPWRGRPIIEPPSSLGSSMPRTGPDAAGADPRGAVRAGRRSYRPVVHICGGGIYMNKSTTRVQNQPAAKEY